MADEYMRERLEHSKEMSKEEIDKFMEQQNQETKNMSIDEMIDREKIRLRKELLRKRGRDSINGLRTTTGRFKS